MAKKTVSLEKTSSGISVVTDSVPGAISSGFMVAVNTGSRDESKDVMGISHLLEHVVFRATKTRSSFQMSKEIEGAGGEINAFTAKEVTAFYGVTMKDTAKTAKDLVADIVTNPLINKKDVNLEKKIVLQEISMWENDPESYIHKLFAETLWKGHELSQNEAGTSKIVKGLDHDDLRTYYESKYRIPNLIVFACGAVEPNDVMEWAESNFDQMSNGNPNVRLAPNCYGPAYKYYKRKGDHCYVGMGFQGYQADHSDRIALVLLSAILGSGSSSRLFQGVREDKALVYSIYNSIDQNSDASSIGTYMSATEENVLEAIETTGKIYRDLKNNGLRKGELDRARNLVKGATVRYTESTEHRMYALAKNFILTGRPDTIQERLVALDAVTENDIMRVAQDVISANALNIVMYGNKVKEMKDFDVSQIDL